MCSEASARIQQAGDEIASLEALLASGCALDGSSIVALRRLVDRVDAVCTAAFAGFVDKGEHLLEGHVGPESWLVSHTAAARGEARDRLSQQRLLNSLPTLARSLTAGRVTIGHIRVLAAAVWRSPARLELARRDEHVLVQAAETLDVSRFAKAVRHWEQLADDELDDRRPDHGRSAKRRVQLAQRPDGTWWLEGVLEPLVGEALNEALDSLMGTPSRADDRTTGQRRHDALRALVDAFLNHGDRPGRPGERPHVTVLVHAETGVAQASSGIVLPAWQRDRLLCDARIGAVFFEPSGRPFDTGTPQSPIPTRTRRAIEARDLHCRWPGCDRPRRFCDVHHLRPRACKGDNDPDWLALLCGQHHDQMHKGGICAYPDPDDPLSIIFELGNDITQTSRAGNPSWTPPRDRMKERARKRLAQLGPPAYAVTAV